MVIQPVEQQEGRLRRPREEDLHAQDPLRQQERRRQGGLLGRKRCQVGMQYINRTWIRAMSI